MPGETRDIALRLLKRIYTPISAGDLAICARATGQALDEAAVEDLLTRDHEDYGNGTDRPVWLCPAIDYPDGLPNVEFLTRSDWPLRTRIVQGVLSEVQELMLLRQFCDIALIAVHSDSESPAGAQLIERIDDLTIHLPSSKLEEMRGRRTVDTSDLVLFRELAEDLYGEKIAEIREEQRDFVNMLEMRPVDEKYFGARQI